MKRRHPCTRRASQNARRNEAAKAVPGAELRLGAGSQRLRPGCVLAEVLLHCVVLMIVTLLFHAHASAGAASEASRTPNSTSGFDAIDDFAKAQMLKQNIPGLAIAVVRNGRVLFIAGYGTARDGEPVTPTTQFRLASLSKSFTAVAVLQLIEAGKVLLDAPVSRYVPEFVASGQSTGLAGITVRQLLNHTSGLADIGFAAGLGRQEKTLAERSANLRSARTVDAPGAAFHYFDPNYQLLARLVEAVSGQPFDVYLQDQIFTPLAMRNTVSAPTSDEGQQRARQLSLGHLRVYGVSVERPELSGFLGGSGGVISTAEDMALFLMTQMPRGRFAGHALLGADSIDLMHSPPPGIVSHYGMGWAASEIEGLKVIEHNGVLSTFYAEMVLLPETGHGFVILVNEYGLAASILAFPVLKNGLIALLSGRPVKGGAMSLPVVGIVLASASALVTGLAVWSLFGVRRWGARATRAPLWHALPGLLWAFTPVLLLLSLPQLMAQTTGRYFGWEMLARAMPELIVLLALWGAIGGVNGLTRIAVLLRSAWRIQARKSGAAA